MFDLDKFLVMRPNPAAGLLADVTHECFGIKLIGAELDWLSFNLYISIQSTPGNGTLLLLHTLKLSHSCKIKKTKKTAVC